MSVGKSFDFVTIPLPTRADFGDRLAPWVGEVGSPKAPASESEAGLR
jgi:hypothetical protein